MPLNTYFVDFAFSIQNCTTMVYLKPRILSIGKQHNERKYYLSISGLGNDIERFGFGNCLGAVMDVQFSKDIIDMDFNRG